MSATTEWKLFADLAEHAGTKHLTLELEAGTPIGDALETILEDRPALKDRIYTDAGELRPQINVLQNGTNVFVAGDGLESQLEDGDELALFPPVSGG